MADSQYSALIKALSAGGGNDISGAIAARQSRAYATNPLINAASLMQPIEIQPGARNVETGMVNAGQSILAALMTAQGIKQAKGETQAYNSKIVNALRGGEQGLESLAGDPETADIYSVLKNERIQKEADARIALTKELAGRGMAFGDNGSLQPLPGYGTVLGAQEAQKSMGSQGMTLDPAGQVRAFPGWDDVLANRESAKEMGKQGMVIGQGGEVGLRPGYSSALGEITAAKQNTPYDRKTAARKEIQASAPYQQLADVVPQFNTLVRLKYDDTIGGDIGFIASVARIWDPNSVVREGEFHINDDRARTLFEQYAGDIGATVAGKTRLGPEVKQRLIQATAQKVAETQAMYNTVAGQIIKGHILPGQTAEEMAPMPLIPPDQWTTFKSVDRKPIPGETKEQWKARVRGMQ